MDSTQTLTDQNPAVSEEHFLYSRELDGRMRERRTRVLIVSEFDQDLVALLDILQHTNWQVSWCRNCEDAASMLRVSAPPVVISAERLPDGAWHTLLERVQALRRETRFIVTAAGADERLWADALHRGAYDVLAKPFRCDEVIRVISCAFRLSGGRHMGIPA